jgi:hypothetical protein
MSTMSGNHAAESDLAILSDAELDEIEARAVARIEIQAIPESEGVLAALIDSVRKDIPHLVAEIRRLRAENDLMSRIEQKPPPPD